MRVTFQILVWGVQVNYIVLAIQLRYVVVGLKLSFHFISFQDPTAATADKGFNARFTRFKAGHKVRLMGPLLSSGLTMSSRFLPALTTMKFRFSKNAQTLLIQKAATVTGDYKLAIDDIYLQIKR